MNSHRFIEEENALLKERIRVLEEGLENIVKSQPCLDNGSCFYPVHDGEGNYVGEQNVDPLSVVQSMAQIAQEALTPTKKE